MGACSENILPLFIIGRGLRVWWGTKETILRAFYSAIRRDQQHNM